MPTTRRRRQKDARISRIHALRETVDDSGLLAAIASRPAALIWPSVKEQIQTSDQAGGVASAFICSARPVQVAWSYSRVCSKAGAEPSFV
jgi:hypothetical protein